MFEIKTLQNGIKVILYEMEYVSSVSIGFFVKIGTVNEINYNNGISHMIEHMLFRGTSKRSSFDIVNSIDNIGSEINAYTSKECTGIHTHVLSDDVVLPIEIISDMIMNSLFKSSEIEKEKDIIVEEIRSYEDDSEELSYDLICKLIYKNTPLAWPILGTIESVNLISREEIIKYYNEFYTKDNIIISIAGKFCTNEIVNLLNNTIGKFENENNNNLSFESKDILKAGFNFKYKNIEQIQLDFAFWGPSETHELLYATYIIDNILAGSMSSRLFQKLREDLGLVYSIYSQVNTYKSIGDLMISISVNPENIRKVANIIINELEKIKTEGISEKEFINSKKYLIGNIILNSESTNSYMSIFAKELILANKIKTIDDIVKCIKNTTLDDINKVIKIIFKSNIAVSAVGKTDKNTIMEIYNNINNLTEV